MKFKKTAAAVMAALTIAPAFAFNAYAANAAVKVEPAFSEFDEERVNGRVIINLPENIDADLKITFDGKDIAGDYYKGTYSSSKSSSYVFDIEGVNVDYKDSEHTYFDERKYNLELSVKDTELNLSSGKYTYEFALSDAEYNPGSWTDYNYVIRTEPKNNDKDYDAQTTTKKENGVTTVETVLTFYLSNSYTLGDVDEDGTIDAMDASVVLMHYANIATQKPGILTETQKKAADVNADGAIDALDASSILMYYADVATGKTPSWR